MNDEILEKLFEEAFEEIHLSVKEKDEILGGSRIPLQQIIENINDQHTKNLLNTYEGQIGLLNAEMYKRFYFRGIEDCIKLIK